MTQVSFLTIIRSETQSLNSAECLFSLFHSPYCYLKCSN